MPQQLTFDFLTPLPQKFAPIERYYYAARHARPAAVPFKVAMQRFKRFRPAVPLLRDMIRLYYADFPKVGATLTEVCWKTGDVLYRAGNRSHPLGFNEDRQQFFLQWGFLEIAKMLCREIEEERKYWYPIFES